MNAPFLFAALRHWLCTPFVALRLWLWRRRIRRMGFEPFVYRREFYRAAPLVTALHPADAGPSEAWNCEVWTTATLPTDPHPELIAPCSPDSC